MTKVRRVKIGIAFASGLLLSLPSVSPSAWAQANSLVTNPVFLQPRQSQSAQSELDRWERLLSSSGLQEEQKRLTRRDSFYSDSEQAEETQAVQETKSEEVRSEIIELTLEYLVPVQGEQIFEVVDDGGRTITRVRYPLRGQMLMIKGEARFSPIFSLEARYGTSTFKRYDNIDTSWVPETSREVWWESYSRTKTELLLAEFNMYLRLFDSQQGNSAFKDLFDLFVLTPQEGRLLIDALGGFQYQRSKFKMTDRVDTVQWWLPTAAAVGDLDSFYKVAYWGPRCGLRTEIGQNRLSGRLSVIYSWLMTKADGWWNLQNYTFQQHGIGGWGLDVNGEVTYQCTPHLSLGAGYVYSRRDQAKLDESGNNNGAVYTDLDIIRNVDYAIHGPYAALKVIW